MMVEAKHLMPQQCMWWLAARDPDRQTVTCMICREIEEVAEPCMLAAKAVNTHTWLSNTGAPDSKAL